MDKQTEQTDLSDVPMDEQPEAWDELDRRLLKRMGYKLHPDVGHKIIRAVSPSRNWRGFGSMWEWAVSRRYLPILDSFPDGTHEVRMSHGPRRRAVVWIGEHADPRAALALAVDKLPMEDG